ncbi:DPP IV N-terminal domain-containing protein [Sphingobacterium sp. T2]|uniref:DPP IV N-terminal domain-containing protein n=1 Tax=Sphingobacterium sp. T2 TaxID=1590596 RepID=UPI000A7809B5|nr:DPP IV N-terminal domain-containing protein [Sphingobacterium sp. T2]
MLKKYIQLTFVGFLLVSSSVYAQRRMTFDEAWGRKPTLTQPISHYQGWADEEHYLEYVRSENRTYKVNVKTGHREVYVPAESKQTEVAVKDNDIVIRFADGSVRQLTNSPDVEEKNPTLSPDGKYVAFTRNNNLFTVSVENPTEVQYTFDGTDVIYNGWSSWVYYEEILGRPTKYKAFWWSPDSKQLAFMRFDDTNVPMFPIYVSKGQNGYVEETRYPKDRST